MFCGIMLEIVFIPQEDKVLIIVLHDDVGSLTSRGVFHALEAREPQRLVGCCRPGEWRLRVGRRFGAKVWF